MFGVSSRSAPSEAIRNASRFEVHTSIPEDFGKHFGSRRVEDVVEWLEGHARGGGIEEYEVTAYDGRTILEVIPARQFLKVARKFT